MTLTLTFLGGAGTVTGSKTLVDSARARVLVDCGMFQGFKHLRLKNRAPFEVQPSSIDTVLLTHAHLDHSGWLPVLVRSGFAGNVLCTAGTRGLVEILLMDAAHLEEEQARWLKKKQKSSHPDPEPLFTSDDAERAIARLVAVPFHEEVEAAPGLVARFTPVGHILGASSIHLAERDAAASSVVFSGDVGRDNDVLVHAPEQPPPADTLVLESTYGARVHVDEDVRPALAAVIQRTVARGGILMVPAFAVGRAQALLLLVHDLIDRGVVPRVPVILNSPMATAVTELTYMLGDELRLGNGKARSLYDVTQKVGTTEESKALNEKTGPMIVIAGSGMMTGGRILHHLAAWGSNPNNTILLAGFQAPGTRGASLLAGARTLRLFGDDVPIRAEVARLEMLSGHADADGLVQWVRSFSWRPRQVLLNHGEPDAADALRQRIERELGLPTRAVLERDTIDIPSAAPLAVTQPPLEPLGPKP